MKDRQPCKPCVYSDIKDYDMAISIRFSKMKNLTKSHNVVEVESSFTIETLNIFVSVKVQYPVILCDVQLHL